MDVSRKILLNLALRYRNTKKHYKQVENRFGWSSQISYNAMSVFEEARNSYNAAKEIYNERNIGEYFHYQ